MRRVEISLLGPARVCLDGEPIRFRTDSTCALLAYLVLHPAVPCRRETLAGLLWPEQPEPAALHNLRQTLLNLRHALGDPGDDSFSTTRHTVQLNLGDNVWADVCAFQAAAAEALGAEALGAQTLAANKTGSAQHPETDQIAQRLAAAVALYRGDLLSGFSYPSAPFEEWMVVEQERLRLQALEILSRLAACHERRAEYELTLRYARRQLELEVWQEEAHRQAMRALALSGRRDASGRPQAVPRSPAPGGVAAPAQ